jgi:hypothetical protein
MRLISLCQVRSRATTLRQLTIALPAPPNLTINDVSVAEGNSGTTTATFTVSLSAPAPSTDITFDIATQDNTATVADNDYVANSLTSRTITTGNSTFTFDVTVNGDSNIEPDETFFVSVTNVSGAPALPKKSGFGCYFLGRGWTFWAEVRTPAASVRPVRGPDIDTAGTGVYML